MVTHNKNQTTALISEWSQVSSDTCSYSGKYPQVDSLPVERPQLARADRAHGRLGFAVSREGRTIAPKYIE